MRSHVFILCLICALSDAVLIAAGVAGLGTLVSRSPALIAAVSLGGMLFLGAYSVMAFRRALHPGAMRTGTPEPLGLKAAVATCLAFTFLNPHVYLDTVVLLGSLSAAYQGADRLAYGLGAVTASFVWFLVWATVRACCNRSLPNPPHGGFSTCSSASSWRFWQSASAPVS